MDATMTNGTPHDEDEVVSSNPDLKVKVEPKPLKLTSSFIEMRSGFLEEIDEFFSTGIIDSLKHKWNSYLAKDVTKRVSMEQALKDKVVSTLKCGDKENNASELRKFLESVLLLCNNELITVISFVNILSDIVDTSTLSVCENLFSFVESNLSSWKNSPFFAPGKNNILRMCNDLLRRLSKAQNTVFCGRILVFLAMFFPFSERSGLNIVSDFNQESLYKIDDEESNISDAVDIVDVTLKVDKDFHSQFWQIQDYFRNPNLCYNKTKWEEFTQISSLIFSSFKKHRLNRDASDRITNIYKKEYFTKFLTSQKLLVLQLSDSNFRRTICLQYLLLFQYLLGQIKTKPENHELSESEQEWVKESTEKIFSLLKETPPDGEQFSIIAKNIVQREEEWSCWKNEGCPAMKKVSSETLSPKSEVHDSLGEKSFTRLSTQAATGFDTIFVPAKDGPPLAVTLKHSFDDYITSLTPAPELKDFLSDAIEEAEKKIDPEKKRVADPSFAWLSVKLISLKAPTFFSNSHTAVPSMSEYVDIMSKKLYRDLNPGLLLPPYMPTPKTVAKKPVTKSQPSADGNLKTTMKPTKSNSGDKTVVKVVKGGMVKIIKAGQGTKIIKEEDSEPSNGLSSKTENNKMDDNKSSDKNKSSISSKTTKLGSSSEKSSSDRKGGEKSSDKGGSESSFAKPSVPTIKSDKHRRDSSSKSPSPKPQRKSDEKPRKEEKKVEKRSRDKSEELPRKEKGSSDKKKSSSRSSPGKRKASPYREDSKSNKVVKVEETKTKDAITKEQIHELAMSIASNWKKVAERLGYKDDEILFFESESKSDYNRALNLLLVWVSDEEDATKETLRKHLKYLGLTSAVSILSK